jgi:hypothetical protein
MPLAKNPSSIPNPPIRNKNHVGVAVSGHPCSIQCRTFNGDEKVMLPVEKIYGSDEETFSEKFEYRKFLTFSQFFSSTFS